MILTTVTLAVMMASQPAPHTKADRTTHAQPVTAAAHHATLAPSDRIAIDLHAMTEDEKRAFPGRERFDKTEWYESLFKSAKIVVEPEHVAEWHNGGWDIT